MNAQSPTVQSELIPSYYFDLSSYRHSKLLNGLSFVWEALDGLPEYLESLELGTVLGDVSRAAYVVNPESIYIGRGTVVEPGAYIKGPCWIGDNCVIRHGAYVRGNVLTGDNCVIGHATEMKGSILLNKAQAAHFAYVGDSILGNRVNLGAGTKCANLKLDGKEVQVSLPGEKVDSGRRKFGVILGDDVQLGCNSVTNPGTLMGPGASAFPCTAIGGFIPKGACMRKSGLYRSRS